jgi:hypothetical protein
MAEPNVAMQYDVELNVDGVAMYFTNVGFTGRANQVDVTRNKDKGASRHVYDRITKSFTYEAPWDKDEPPPLLEAGGFFPAVLTFEGVTYTGTVGIDEVSRPGGQGGVQQQNGTATFTGSVVAS